MRCIMLGFARNPAPRTIAEINPANLNSAGDVAIACRVFHESLKSTTDPAIVKIKNQFVTLEQCFTLLNNALRFIANAGLFNTASSRASDNLSKIRSLDYFYSLAFTTEITDDNREDVGTALLISEKMLNAVLPKMRQHPEQYFPSTAWALVRVAGQGDKTVGQLHEMIDEIVAEQRGAKTILPLRIALFDAVKALKKDDAASEQQLIKALDEMNAALDGCFDNIMNNQELFKDDTTDDETSPNWQPMPSWEKTMLKNILTNMTLCMTIKSLCAKRDALGGEPFSAALTQKINAMINKVNANDTIWVEGAKQSMMDKRADYKAWFVHIGLPHDAGKLQPLPTLKGGAAAPSNSTGIY